MEMACGDCIYFIFARRQEPVNALLGGTEKVVF
jgi:hypothetical protein